MSIVKTPNGIRVFWSFLLLVALVAAPLAARAQSDEIIEKVTKQNKKAVEEYENLNFEEARKLLKDALDICSQNGLDKHPIKARTHIHLGIVILAGFKQREVAIKQFRKALEIQPEIKLTKTLANPEIQEAFDEAVAGMGSPEKPDAAEKPEKGEKPEKADKGEKSGGEGPITHESVTEGTQGGAITISAHVDFNLGVKKMILAYRPDGASEFLGRVMKEVTQGNWSAEIPASATAGNRVAYYIEAQGDEEKTLGTRGTADDPLVIVLKGSGAPAKDGEEEEEDDEDEAGPKWFLGLGIGSGAGYTQGNAEVNSDLKVKGGFAPASLGHLSPEIGYFVSSHWMLSVQLRLQLVSGVNQLKVPGTDQCGADNICNPAKSAFAVLARGTYVFGEENFHPYLSVLAGGGQIRHVASFPSRQKCGASGMQTCVDTVLAGPVFAGGGGGVMFNASKNFLIMAGVNALLDFPDFGINFDFNAGIGVEF